MFEKQRIRENMEINEFFTQKDRLDIEFTTSQGDGADARGRADIIYRI